MLFCPMASFMVQYRVSVWSPRGKAMQHIENTGLPAAHLNLCTTNVTTWLAFWGKKSFHRFLCAEHFDLVTGCFKKNSSHGHKCADWRSSADVSTRQLMCPHVSWCFWMFLTVSQRLWQTDCCEGQMWFTALSCVCVDVCAESLKGLLWELESSDNKVEYLLNLLYTQNLFTLNEFYPWRPRVIRANCWCRPWT